MSPGHKNALVALIIAVFPLILLELSCFFPQKIQDNFFNTKFFNYSFFIFYCVVMYLYTQNLV